MADDQASDMQLMKISLAVSHVVNTMPFTNSQPFCLPLLAAVFCVALSPAYSGATDESEFPAEVQGATVAQLEKLMQRAADQEMVPAGISVSVRNNTPFFDCRFQSNESGMGWFVLLNVQRGKLLQHDRRYVEQGMARAIEKSVRIRGRTYYSVVWKEKPQTDKVLQLPAGGLPETGVETPECAALDRFFRTFMKENKPAGLAVAIAKEGAIVYSRGFGFADVQTREPMKPDAMMRIASISKPLTSIGALRMIEQGTLRLDARVLPILQKKGYRLPAEGDKRWKDITVRHLLQHSGGWDRDQSGDPMFKVVEVTRKFSLRKPARQADILRFQLEQPLDFDPGTRYAYSNFGFSVLGRVMEIESGLDYASLIQQLVLSPAGMTRTRLGATRLEDRMDGEVRYHLREGKLHTPFWTAADRNRNGRVAQDLVRVEEPYGRWDLEVMDAHGGWVSTAPDLLRMVATMEASENSLLTEASRRQMLAAPVFADPDRTIWYGLGWQVREKRSAQPDRRIMDCRNIWHSGALAGTSTLLVRRFDRMSWAILFNTDRASGGERLSTLADSQMHFAVNSVEAWPEAVGQKGSSKDR